MKLVTVAEMRAIEAEADARGLQYAQMMENAGLGVAQVVENLLDEEEEKRVCALVGTGNNGGDALVALAHLQAWGWQTGAYLIRPRAGDPLVERLRASGGEVVEGVQDDEDLSQLDGLLATAGVLLDGVLGTGAKLPLKSELAVVLERAQAAAGGLLVVAVDCPSGVDCDSGEAAAQAIPADVTVCMAAVKTGLLKLPASELAGELRVVTIGNLDGLPAWESIITGVVTADQVSRILPARAPGAHKGTFGAAMIVAGSLNYTGAALLAGKAAYRVGSGLVRMAVPGPLYGALAGALPEATWLLLPHEMGVISAGASEIVCKNLEKATALLVGPGLGSEETTAGFIRRLLGDEAKHPARAGMGFGLGQPRPSEPDTLPVLPPVVIDADALRLLARIPDWGRLLPGEAVLTPHPGEMSALTGIPVEEIQTNRLQVARDWARTWGHVVVLKGAFTVIAAPDGRAGVIPVATAALARAGTGDVLAGMITGLRAQGMNAFEAASAAAWLHAQAGLLAAARLGTETSVLASDVLEVIPAALQEVETRSRQ